MMEGGKSISGKTVKPNANKRGTWDCHKIVATKYKFFLAFEDSICKDFVTEKFFAMFNGGLDMVPVVLGGANYSTIAPPNSYIDASDFGSPKALAHHLKVIIYIIITNILIILVILLLLILALTILYFTLQLLDADDAKYNAYFWWRKFYQRRFNHHQSICDLCERLHTDKSTHIYSDMRDWWVDQASCSTKTILSQDDMI